MGAVKAWCEDIAWMLVDYAEKYDDEMPFYIYENRPNDEVFEIAKECCLEWCPENWRYNAFQYLFQTVSFYHEELLNELYAQAEFFDQVIYETDADWERDDFTERHKYLSSIIAVFDWHDVDYSDVVVETSSLKAGDVVAVREPVHDKYVVCKVVGVNPKPYVDMYPNGNPNNILERKYVVLVSKAA